MDEPPDPLPWPCLRRRSLRLVPLACTALMVLALSLSGSVDENGDDATTNSHVRSRERTVRELQDASSCTEECCETNYKETLCGSSENEWISAVPFAVQIILIILLVALSAMFSGLTLGLMGLDKTGLEIVMEADDEKNALAAKRIYPVRANGNLLLCTLLIGNVSVNALLSILLADKAGGIIGFLASTALITIFGEITPQAACSRYALEIGSRSVWLVKVFIVLLYPVAKPLSMALDYALGEELATTYSSSEMRKLLEIHVKEGRFDQETAGAMQGALQYKEIPVKQVMTPLEHVFMLSVDSRLSFETIATIFKSGYSRIPVYEISVNNIIGLLFVKDLIFIDPEDETPVRNFVELFGRGVHVVWPDDKLGDVLRELKQGRSHMAIVRDVNNNDETRDPFYEVEGIITLEDIIEEIIGDEIVDETDAFVDQTHSVKVKRTENFDWGRLRLLDAKIVEESLSYEESKAVVAHLRTNYSETVSLVSDHQLYRFVSETPVSELPTAEQELGELVPQDLLYEKGLPSGACTLILSGKVTVLAGADQFRSDVSSWSVLGATSLTDPSYVPDFSAFVSGGPCRCLRLTREGYMAAVDASAVEKSSSSHHERVEPPVGQEPSSNVMEISRSSSERRPASDSAVYAPEVFSKQKGSTHARRNKLIEAFQNARTVTTNDPSPPPQENPGSGKSSRRSPASFEEGAQGSSESIQNGPASLGELARPTAAFEYIGSSRLQAQDDDSPP